LGLLLDRIDIHIEAPLSGVRQTVRRPLRRAIGGDPGAPPQRPRL